MAIKLLAHIEDVLKKVDQSLQGQLLNDDDYNAMIEFLNYCYGLIRMEKV
jgi:hypothetical protein